MSYYKLKNEHCRPYVGSEGAAGLDLRADAKGQWIEAGKEYFFCTGVAFEIPFGWVGLVFPRSGMGVKYTLRLLNTVGVIDSDYRDYVKVACTFEKSFWLEDYERIAQMVTLPIMLPTAWLPAEELTETERGTNGFGSSGRT
ncbi:putative deoxyUTP pyrophosphatase [Vibrio phage VCPH]|nr:putative deoxyUTP pyrophosphatase [Vibrio phage VCPH]